MKDFKNNNELNYDLDLKLISSNNWVIPQK